MNVELSDDELIKKGLSRSNLTRTEQRRLELLAKDKIDQTKSQAVFIKKLLNSLKEKE